MTVKTFQVTEDLDLCVSFFGVRGATKRYIENASASSSDDSIATARIEDDVVIVTPKQIGTVRITVAADAQPGEGEKPVSGMFVAEIVAANADRVDFGDQWTADRTVEAPAPVEAPVEAPAADVVAAPVADAPVADTTAS